MAAAAAAGAAEGAEIGAFAGPMGMALGGGIGIAAAAAAASSASFFNPANPSDPNTSASSSSHQAPVIVHGGDAWHNPASPSLSPGAQAVINGTGHHIPAPPPRKRGADFYGLDSSDGFTADDDEMPEPAPRGIRRFAPAAAADRGKKGKILHDRKWEGKDRAPAQPRGYKFLAFATEPIQGYTSASDSSSTGIVVASARPRPPPPPPEQGSGGYATDHGPSRNVRPHALPQHRANPFGDWSSGSEGAGGASASNVGPMALKDLQTAMKAAAKKKPPTYGPMATNYRNTSASASSSSRGPLPPAPPPARPPDSDSSARSRGSRPDRNSSARSGQR